MKRIVCLILVTLLAACSTPPVREDSKKPDDRTATLTAEESRRRAEEAYENMIRRQKEQEARALEEQAEKVPQKKNDSSDSIADSSDPANPEKTTEGDQARIEAERQKRLEEARLAEETRKQREREEAASLLKKDREEERAAELALELYDKNRPLLQKEAAALQREDTAEQTLFNSAYQQFAADKERDAQYRSSRLAKVDPNRDYFFRSDARNLFPARLEILDVRSRSIQLMRNRNAQQFMAYTKGMKYVPSVQNVPLPGGPAARLRLYEFFKGRPGNYVLLEDGQPLTIKVKNQEYRIINIRSDGDVLILLDLERKDLREYYRLSVDDLVLVLE